MPTPSSGAEAAIRPLLRRLAIELGPVFVFFGVFVWQGIMPATGAFMAAAALSVVVSGFGDSRLPRIPLLAAVLIMVFGGLTLTLGEETFIKLHPTVSNGLFALTIGGARLLGYDFLERSFGRELHLTEEGWRRLTWRTVAYLAALSASNELVWRSFDTEIWAAYKTFGLGPMNLVFAGAQISLLRAHWRNGDS